MNDDHLSSRAHRSRHGGIGTAILGLGIAAAGIILTLDNLGLVDAEQLLPYWPVLLILLGLSHILRPPAARNLLAAGIWIGVGAVLLVSNLDLLDIDLWDIWPLLLVLLGLRLLLRGFRRRQMTEIEDLETFDATAILGSVTRRIAAPDLKGGTATAIMGGCEIDLRDCPAGDEPVDIDVLTFWGGIEIRIPRDWEVQVKGTAILGSFEDKTVPPIGPPSRALVVRGLTIMAGVEIKS
jgi:hypothetical protein